MDFNLIFQPLVAVLWYLVPFLIIAGIVKTFWFKSKFGVFVVEAKNIKGWIFGSAKKPFWTALFSRKPDYSRGKRKTWPRGDVNESRE
jgi:hypothetical protein